MLEKVVNVVKEQTSIFDCKTALSKVFGDKSVSYMTTMAGYFVVVKVKDKKVCIAPKSAVDYLPEDVVCGDLVVGFID